jgi:hypothetical protein
MSRAESTVRRGGSGVKMAREHLSLEIARLAVS